MTNKLFFLGLLSLAAGCDGRLVGIPTTPAGYAQAQARDVTPMGVNDANIQLDTVLGPMVPTEDCGGLVTFPLPEATPQIANADAVELMGKANLVLTIPRARYNEVRDLRANDHVLVRGYVTNSYFANGCSAPGIDNTRRWVWIDSIQKLPSST